MDVSFDLVALLKVRPVAKTQTNKRKPTQFESVAGGVQKRLEKNIKDRRSSRLSIFDRARNITKCASPLPPPVTEAQSKAEHRKQQLQKFKAEKEKKKKEAAAQKKKPFLASVAQKSTFGPPPPPRPVPSTSGRVTRSQARTQRNEQAKQPNSFAPRNAVFKPPQFKSIEVPTLAPINKKKPNKSVTQITFEPVLPKVHRVESSRLQRTKSGTTKLNASESKVTRKPNYEAKGKSLPSPKPPLRKQYMSQTSSSSDSDQASKRVTLRGRAANHTHSRDIKQQNTKRNPPPKPLNLQSSSSSDLEIRKNKVTRQREAMVTQDLTSMSQESTDQEVLSSEEVRTPRNKIPKSESSSEEKLRSPKSLKEPLTPEQIIEESKKISPCVTLSRGKDNARREMKLKLKEGLLDEDNSNMDSVNHFRRQLDSEIARITEMCDTWDKVFAQTVLPEPVQELVLAAVGQARLLMSQKLQQFAGLLQRCEQPHSAAGLVTPADLHGFWDMVFMQVENVDMRFKKLEELRACNWMEKEAPQAKKVVAKPAAKPAAKKPKPSAGPSRLREMIAAARKAKKDQDSDQSSVHSSPNKSEPNPPECKTFEAGFFSISSPLKAAGSPAPCTPQNKLNLLKTVLSSEARKASASKNSTSFAMLRASMMSKNVDIEGVSPLSQTPPPVNLFATPARSILKQANPASSRKPDKLKTVLFHESDGEQPASSPLSYTSCVDKEMEAVTAEGEKEKEEVVEEKENTPARRRRRPRLSHQNAVDHTSPMMTRSRRKSAQTPLAATDVNIDASIDTSKRSSKPRKEDTTETPKRSSRRRKSNAVC